jgi:hypothetical protein
MIAMIPPESSPLSNFRGALKPLALVIAGAVLLVGGSLDPMSEMQKHLLPTIEKNKGDSDGYRFKTK